jgi:ATP-dependent DNA ligase
MDTKTYISQAQTYKRSVASRYLPAGSEEIVSKIREADQYLLSIKYDGHFYLLCCEKGAVTLVSPGGNVIDDLPMLADAKSLMEKAKVKDACIPGELYFRKENRSRVFDLTANLDDKSPDICFAAFDILSIDGKKYERSELVEKHKILDELFPEAGKVHSVGSKSVESRKDIQDYFKQVVETDGQEGVVVKSSEGMIYKLKPRCTLDGVVIGFVEGEGDRSGMLREVLVAMLLDNKTYQITAKVGNGFTDDERKNLLMILEKSKVESNYIEASGAKVAFTMVKPEMVIEYSSIDLAVETSKGTIRKMSLSYGKEGYSAEQSLSCVSSMSPVFLRIRNDKTVNKDDIRFSQITDIVELAGSGESVELEKSEILKREVFVKKSKDQKMVRKFILWKTNKENDPDYPAFVFHYTDFSPTRKDMLKKDVKVSDSKKQIEQIYADEIAENVKKGWEPV